VVYTLGLWDQRRVVYFMTHRQSTFSQADPSRRHGAPSPVQSAASPAAQFGVSKARRSSTKNCAPKLNTVRCSPTTVWAWALFTHRQPRGDEKGFMSPAIVDDGRQSWRRRRDWPVLRTRFARSAADGGQAHSHVVVRVIPKSERVLRYIRTLFSAAALNFAVIRGPMPASSSGPIT
jgi:hypothetical protein